MDSFGCFKMFFPIDMYQIQNIKKDFTDFKGETEIKKL